jgi:hypothetical protein
MDQSRNTESKYLASSVTASHLSRAPEPEQAECACRDPVEWLKRKAHRPRKQRCNLKQFYHDLLVSGYTGSHDRVVAGIWLNDRFAA